MTLQTILSRKLVHSAVLLPKCRAFVIYAIKRGEI